MTLLQIITQLLARGKGILAADESIGTCDKRFEKYGVAKTPEMRRAWRELLFSTSHIEHGLSGVILFDETIRQKTSGGVPFAEFLARRGILPGIKVDQKTELLAGSPHEEITKGLEGLPERLAEYEKMGARFAKWRAVIQIGEGLPTERCLLENAKRLAKYAKDCQDAGLVPILEPEVLLDGTHTLVQNEEVLTEALQVVFDEARKAKVNLSALILKSSMALPGKESGEQASTAQVAEATVHALAASVPKEVPGIVFLSGGQSPEDATTRLNEVVRRAERQHAPWHLSFSYSRALQDPVLAAWAGRDENRATAQAIFEKRVNETARASTGSFSL